MGDKDLTEKKGSRCMLASPAQRAKGWTGDGRTGAVIRVETPQQGRVTRRITSRPLFKRVLPHLASSERKRHTRT